MISDNDLLVLENLTYLDEEGLRELGATKTLDQCSTVAQFLEQFSEEKLKNAGISRRFRNDRLEDTLGEVESYIRAHSAEH